MASTTIKHGLNKEETNSFIAPYLANNISTNVVVFINTSAIRYSLEKKDKVSVSTSEIFDSVQRMLESGGLKILASDVILRASDGQARSCECSVLLTCPEN
ncbi:MAG: hypothetical protein HYT61_01995 [Candidatus Yanofskybacteria bacterium]|nr:hypothetical protein [Candidatus Yanofskybacteria bacterium]